jgi:hypothetical protein
MQDRGKTKTDRKVECTETAALGLGSLGKALEKISKERCFVILIEERPDAQHQLPKQLRDHLLLNHIRTR